MKYILKGSNIVLCLLTLSILCADSIASDTIHEMNKIVDKILEKKTTFNHLEVKLHVGVTEGSPPHFRYYFDQKTRQVQFLHVSVGHETWSSNFYYFFKNDKIIKFLKEVDRPDNPPKLAIIYDLKGKKLWGNTSKLPFSPKLILDIFKNVDSSLDAFVKY